LIKNSEPFGKKFQKTVGGIFLTNTEYGVIKRDAELLLMWVK